MKKIYQIAFVVLMISSGNAFAQYTSQDITLLARWFDPSVPAEPGYGIKYNSVWGYYDAIKKKEYAIIGSSAGTYFIDVTNPALPAVKDYVPGRRDSCIWREYKNYGKYLYAVSDDVQPNSMQIMDMSYLPDSVHVVHDADTIMRRAHTIYIDKDRLYFGVARTIIGTSPMAVYSLANPEKPVLLRKLETDYPSIGQVHDMLVRNDTVYASCGYQGLHIYKFTGNAFIEIESLVKYPQQGYNHSSALSPDGKNLYFTDEVPVNLAVKSLDISDMNNITVVDTFRSSFTATPHNLYLVGSKRLVVAYYQDGLQIFDVSDPANVSSSGYFDTSPLNGVGLPNPSYSGCWGAYVDLPSGIILASDMQNGLFILDASIALGVQNTLPKKSGVTVFPNPSRSNFTINIALARGENIRYELFDIAGRKIISETKNLNAGNNSITLQTEKLALGTYVLKVQGTEIMYAEKLMKIK